MIKIKYFLLVLSFLTLTNCNTDKHEFPLDKRYWNASDYDKVVLELRFGYEKDEKLPTFNNPKNRLVVEKLTDEQNYKIVLEDNELGVSHRNKVAEDFFSEWKDMTKIYDVRDRKDNYIYEKELLAVWHFGLGLQLTYFELGNEHIKERADDPNSSRVKNNINSNVASLIKNYLIYLDKINTEDSFTEEGKKLIAEGIDKYFSQLIQLYPDANYGAMKRKAE